MKMADKPYVVAIVGSPRVNGNTSHLVDVALAELDQRGARCEKIMLGDYRVLPCEGHDECGDLAACPIDDDASSLLEKMYAADGLLLATPVYFEDVSGPMKMLIDRNCFNNYHEIWLAARTVGLIAVADSTGVEETIDSLGRFVALVSDRHVRPLSVHGFATRVGDAEGNRGLVGAARKMAKQMAGKLFEEKTAGKR